MCSTLSKITLALALCLPLAAQYTPPGGGGGSPAGILSCGVLDNAICTSSVDANGNPNFLTTAAGTALPINGGTTPLNMFIGGVYQTLNSNVTLTVPSTASVQQWILAKQDTANGGLLVAADFLAMNTAPYYQYTAPTCPSPSPALSSSNPSFWYNLAANVSELCTSNAGSYTPTSAMVIGTIYVDATPKVLQVLAEPYRLNPYKRYQQFGTGADGVLTITSGTTTIDVHKQYQSVLMTAGTLTHQQITASVLSGASIGVSFYSQSPVLFIGTATVQANSLGRSGAAGTTGAGAGASSGTLGGGGGGGGGSGMVSATGGAGGNKTTWQLSAINATGGGAGGAASPTAGSPGTSTQVPMPPQSIYLQTCMAPGGGSGAGDATNAGGNGGAGGGSIFVSAPSILAISTASITANGANGSAGVGGNAAGGGGGGGGCVVLNAGFLNTSAATITATGGTGGAKFGAGSGTAGGNGGTGSVQQNRLW